MRLRTDARGNYRFTAHFLSRTLEAKNAGRLAIRAVRDMK